MSDTKRKTTTSTTVKQRNINKNNTQFNCRLRNDEAAEILKFIQSKGWSKAEFLKAAYELLKGSNV